RDRAHGLMRPARPVPRAGLAAVALALALGLALPAQPAMAGGVGRSVLLAFVPAPPPPKTDRPDPFLRALAARPSLDVGLMSATQGNYSPEQELLDVTQGIRASPTAYRPSHRGPLGPGVRGRRGPL